MRRESGSALITVILVVLVLTMVGLAAMFYMNVKDTMSGNDRYQKEALYLAEIGLRQGEAVILGTATSSLTGLVAGHGNSNDEIPPTLADCTGLVDSHGNPNLGAVIYNNGSPLWQVPYYYNATGTNPTGDRVGYYTVYARNNKLDNSGSSTIDSDGIVDIIAIGIVEAPGGAVKYTKILEEEFNLAGASTGQAQVGSNAGNTNTMPG